MAVATFTVGEIIDRLSDFVEGRSSQDSLLRGRYLMALQHSMETLIFESDFNAFRTQGTISTVDGTSTYDLADDFSKVFAESVIHAIDPQERIEYIEQSIFDARGSERVYGTTKGKPRVWTMKGVNSADGARQVEFHPIPDAVYSVRYIYLATPSNFEADSDGSTVVDRRFPERFKYAIVHGALAEMFADRLEPQELNLHVGKFEQAKQQMRGLNQVVMGASFRRERFDRRDRRFSRPSDRFVGGQGGWQNP